MQSLEDALRDLPLGAGKTTLAIVSAVGSSDLGGLSAIESALDRTVEIILEQLVKSDPDATLQVACCIETFTEAALAARMLLKHRVSPALIAPIDPPVLLDQITAGPTREALSAHLSGAITVLDSESVSLDQAPAEPTLGQRLAIRTADILFLALPNFSDAQDWITTIRNEYPFPDGLVIAATPNSNEPLRLVALETRDLVPVPLEELRFRLARRLSVPGTTGGRTNTFEHAPRFSSGGFLNVFLALASGRLMRDWHFFIGSPRERSEESLRWPPELDVLKDAEIVQLDKLRRQFALPFAWADIWAIHYGNLFRLICLLLLFLNLVAVATAVLGYFDSRRSALWHICEFLSLVGVFLLYAWGRGSKIHKRWVEYRLFAELLRPTPYYWALADMYAPREPQVHAPERDWWQSTVRQYRRLLASMEHPPIRMSDHYVYSLKKLLEGFVEEQRAWHERFHGQNEAYHKRFVGAGRFAFWSVLAAAASHLVLRHFGGHFTSIATDTESALAAMFLAAACVLAAIGFVIGILIHQFGFDRIAERSEIAATRLGSLLRRMQAPSVVVRREQVGEWLAECTEILIHEQTAWFRHTAKIAIHL
jgi:hypothetical protein